MGPKRVEVVVSDLERRQLVSMSRSRSLPHSLVGRARIVLMDADGFTNLEAAMQCEVMSPAITHWKKRFVVVCGRAEPVHPGRDVLLLARRHL